MMDELSYLNTLANKIILNCCKNKNENIDNSIFNNFIDSLKMVLKVQDDDLDHLQPTKEDVERFIKYIDEKFDELKISSLNEINELFNILRVKKNSDDLIKRVKFINDKINHFTNTNDIYVYLLDGHGRTLLLLLSLITKNTTNKIHIIIPEIDYYTQLWH